MKKAKEYWGNSPKISIFVIATKQDTKLLSHAQRYNNFLRTTGIFPEK
jgi:hypothetical protein